MRHQIQDSYCPHPVTLRSAPTPVLSIRVDPDNPDHHLWRNHGTWWVHYVVHEGNRKRRVRRSLATRCVQEARALRDQEFARLAQQAAAVAGAAAHQDSRVA